MTKINEILLEKGIKKGFLAQKLGVSNATITRYCQGKTYPNIKNIKKIAKYLDVDVRIFFLEEDKTNT